ncbi:MAG TPA: YggU family protein [Nitrospirae bacterium]|nr:YggU family protein [Nitrospirota bacterium]
MKFPYKKSKGGITIDIKVEPRSSSAGIQGIVGDTVKVKLTSAPVDGAANKQLIELLAKELGIRKSAFKIIRGEKSRNKVIRISGMDAP